MIDDDLREQIKSALEGDSNDEEHDALAAVAEALGISWSPEEDDEIISVEISPWRAEHSGSPTERTADIWHESKAGQVDATMLNAAWDGNVSRYSREITEEDVREALQEWIDEQAETHLAELPFLP